jgi:hypothetical protein
MNLKKPEVAATQSTNRTASNHPGNQEIAARAYEIFLARGATRGNDVEDWLQADRELAEKSRDSALLQAMAIR